jgi:hypothetical protein
LKGEGIDMALACAIQCMNRPIIDLILSHAAACNIDWMNGAPARVPSEGSPPGCVVMMGWMERILTSDAISRHKGRAAVSLIQKLVDISATMASSSSSLQCGYIPCLVSPVTPSGNNISGYGDLMTLLEVHTRDRITSMTFEGRPKPRRLASRSHYAVSRVASVLAPLMASQYMNVFVIGCHHRCGEDSSIKKYFRDHPLFDAQVTSHIFPSIYLSIYLYLLFNEIWYDGSRVNR